MTGPPVFRNPHLNLANASILQQACPSTSVHPQYITCPNYNGRGRDWPMCTNGEALRESERHWLKLFEQSPAMHFMVDASGTILFVSAFAASHLGYAMDELVGRSITDVVFEEDKGFVRRYVAVCLATPEQLNSWEVRKIRNDGTLIWVRANGKALRWPDNQ